MNQFGAHILEKPTSELPKIRARGKTARHNVDALSAGLQQGCAHCHEQTVDVGLATNNGMRGLNSQVGLVELEIWRIGYDDIVTADWLIICNQVIYALQYRSMGEYEILLLDHDRNRRAARIVTHRLYIPWFHREAIEQTTAWLEHHGVPYWDLCFMRDKAAVGANLYLEDSPTNIEALRSDGHATIAFRNSTNRHLPPPYAENWTELEGLIVREIEQWEGRDTRRRLAGV